MGARQSRWERVYSSLKPVPLAGVTSAHPAGTYNFSVGLSQSDGVEILVVGVLQVLGQEEYASAVARSGKVTSGSSQDRLVTRILPSLSGTATSESLSVLAWIWLMDPRVPLILPLPENYW